VKRDPTPTFLYPTVHEICVQCVTKLQIPTVSYSTHVERCGCFVIIVHNITLALETCSGNVWYLISSTRGPVMTVKRCAADVVQYSKVFQMSAC